MFSRTSLLTALAVLLVTPGMAAATPTHASVSAPCFGQVLDVQQPGVGSSNPPPLVVKLRSLQPHPRHADKLHVVLQVQKWDGAKWVEFVTDLHNTSYARKNFARVHPRQPGTVSRTWTLQENNAPVVADAQMVPTRVNARITGICRGHWFNENRERQLLPPQEVPYSSLPAEGGAHPYPAPERGFTCKL